MNLSMKFMQPKSDARRPPLPAAVVSRGTGGLQGKAMSWWRRRAEQDRSAADEWDRIAAGVRDFLRDDPTCAQSTSTRQRVTSHAGS